MADAPPFETAPAHRYFSAGCFNETWVLIDKPDRSPEDNEQMIRLAQASLWHWTQRPDCNDTNLSVGYWLASRVHALVGEPDNARKYARLCQDKAPDEPFYQGYACEAMARAEIVAGNNADGREHLEKAWHFAERVADPEEKQMLVDDLRELE